MNMRKIIVVLFVLIFISLSCKVYCQTRVGNITKNSISKQIDDYFERNMALLDPIEGVWHLEIIVKAWNNYRTFPEQKIFDKYIVLVKDGTRYKDLYSDNYITKKGTNVYLYHYYITDPKGRSIMITSTFTFSDLMAFSVSCDLPLEADMVGSRGQHILNFNKHYPTREDYIKSIAIPSDKIRKSNEWSGSGFALNNGYVVTNYHVIDGAKSIEVHGVNGNASSNYTATVVATDKKNDLAIVQITDPRFKGFGTIPYAIKKQIADVGEDIWVLGYPLTQILGNEIKLTTGVVSSRSGYQGDVATYQISAPVQPGNSGGPMFDSKGNLVGIVNSGVPGAENVGYAIKTLYLVNLADRFASARVLPSTNSISGLSRPDQIKNIKNYVFLLKCSSNSSNHSSSSNSELGKGRNSVTSQRSSSSNISTPIIIRDFSMRVNDMVQLKTGNLVATKWESEDETIAKINSNGVVFGRSEGRVRIWAHLENGRVSLFNVTISNLASSIDSKIASMKSYAKTISSDSVELQDSIELQETKKISGIVRSSQQEALMGVMITVEGKNELSVTKSNGQFSIQASVGDTLVFSNSGYNPISVKVKTNQMLEVIMTKEVDK